MTEMGAKTTFGLDLQTVREAAADGKLLCKECRNCGETHYYPRALCPHCFSADLRWREAAGTGTVYSFSISEKPDGPQFLAFVTLEEGITLLTNIVDCAPDKLAIGMPVTLLFRELEGDVCMPFFRPIGECG